MTPPLLSRRRALTCIAINLVATPGLGSLFARRYFAGTLQLIVGLAGFFLTTAWMLKSVYASVSPGMDNADSFAPAWLWEWGTILFCISWLWSLVTSIELWRDIS